MMRKTSLLAILLGCLGAVQSKANLIFNGGFEAPVCSAPGGVCGLATPTGWTLIAGNVDIVNGNYWQQAPGGGNQNIDLNGDTNGDISQDFTSVAGGNYTLMFLLAGNANGGPTLKTFNILVGPSGGSLATLASPSFDTIGHTNASMGYVLETFSFATTTALTTLEFQSTSGGTAYGPVLDNVDIEAVPEPVSFLLVSAGLGLLASFRRRRI